MIRPCTQADFDAILAIVNDAAEAYRGVIPTDRWHDPYMSVEELREELADGVAFWGLPDDAGQLVGIMGIQDRGEVTLVRHAYVRTSCRRAGVGTKLLLHLETLTAKTISHAKAFGFALSGGVVVGDGVDTTAHANPIVNAYIKGGTIRTSGAVLLSDRDERRVSSTAAAPSAYAVPG